jgi:hypothetical protein
MRCSIQNMCAKSRHILCSITFLLNSCRWKDRWKKWCTAGKAKDHNITRRMRIACWITKAAVTDSEYVIITAFPRQQWLGERASVSSHMYMYMACWMLHLVMHGVTVRCKGSNENVMSICTKCYSHNPLGLLSRSVRYNNKQSDIPSERHMSTDRSHCTVSCQNCHHRATKTNTRHAEISLPSSAETQLV